MEKCKNFVERRAWNRYDVLVPCYIEGEPLLSFTMQNVSKGGCRLQTSVNTSSDVFSEGEKYVINVSPPHLSSESLPLDDSFDLTISLRWQDEKNNIFIFGFEILQSDKNDFNNWLDFIVKRSKAKGHPKKRLA